MTSSLSRRSLLASLAGSLAGALAAKVVPAPIAAAIAEEAERGFAATMAIVQRTLDRIRPGEYALVPMQYDRVAGLRVPNGVGLCFASRESLTIADCHFEGSNRVVSGGNVRLGLGWTEEECAADEPHMVDGSIVAMRSWPSADVFYGDHEGPIARLSGAGDEPPTMTIDDSGVTGPVA